MTMGTASTMTSAAEALGMTLPGAASIPAADSRHAVMADADGQAHRRDGVGGPQAVATSSPRTAIHNAVTAVLAIGGSTNADRASDRARAPRRASRSTWTRSTRSRARRRCSPTSGPPALI